MEVERQTGFWRFRVGFYEYYVECGSRLEVVIE